MGMFGEGLQLKTTVLLIFYMWLVKTGKQHNFDHLEKCGLFSDFQYGFRSPQSTTDLLEVVSDWMLELLGLLSMLIILLSILSEIERLICGSNLNWPLNLNLIYETLWTGTRSGFLISKLGKLNCFCLNGLITLFLLM